MDSSPRCGIVSKVTLPGSSPRSRSPSFSRSVSEVPWSRVSAPLIADSSRSTAVGLKRNLLLVAAAEDRPEELLLALDPVEVAVHQAVALPDERERLIAHDLLRSVDAVESAVTVVDVGDVGASRPRVVST